MSQHADEAGDESAPQCQIEKATGEAGQVNYVTNVVPVLPARSSIIAPVAVPESVPPVLPASHTVSTLTPSRSAIVSPDYDIYPPATSFTSIALTSRETLGYKHQKPGAVTPAKASSPTKVTHPPLSSLPININLRHPSLLAQAYRLNYPNIPWLLVANHYMVCIPRPE